MAELKVVAHANVEGFREAAMPFLLAEEAKNCMIIGLIDTLTNNPRIYPNPNLNTIHRKDEVIGAFWMTPPHPLGFTDLPEEAIPLLLTSIEHWKTSINALSGVGRLGPTLAKAFTEKFQRPEKSRMEQFVYELHTLTPAPRKPGRMRLMEEKDLPLIRRWSLQYSIECLQPVMPEIIDRSVQAALQLKNRYVWDLDGVLQSMASFSGSTPNGIRINWVFTPDECRGQGIASVLTSDLTAKLLNEGKKRCFLYTDQGNPISNHVYSKLGYERVCDAFQAEFSYR